MKLGVDVLGDGPGRSWECDVDVSATTSGADLCEYLDGHVADCGVATDESWRWWLTDGRPLAAVSSVTTEVPRGAVLTLGTGAPEPPAHIALESPMSGLRADLTPGIHSIGGSPDDDLPVAGLPPRSAVLEVRSSGSVILRRSEAVRGGDEDDVFGSPTAGRALRLDPPDDQHVEFHLDDVSFLLRRFAAVVPAGSRPINRTPYRPVREGRRDLDEFPAPPPSPRSNRVAVTTFVVPLATGVGMAALLGRPQFLLIALLAPLALGVVHLLQRRSGARSFAAERSQYRERLAVAVEDAASAALAAHVDAHRASPEVTDCVRVALRRERELWQRAAGGPHLLRLRVGSGRRGPVVHASVAVGGDPALRAEAESALADGCRPPGVVPVTVDVDVDVAVAVCGPPDVAFGLARALLAQTVTHHGPEDVVVAAALSTAALGRLRGLESLPHVGADAGPLRLNPIAAWPDGIDRLLTALVDAASVRSDVVDGARRPPTPRVLLVVDDRAAVDRGTLERLLEVADASGVRLLWVGEDPDLVPRQCRSVVLAHVAGDATVTTTDPAVDSEPCRIETLAVADFDAVARALAPCFDAASPERSGALPSQVALDDVAIPTTSAAVGACWNASDGSSLAAPIGVTGRGAFGVDLVVDGPHALVAGTTGSGKSELLQTWVASMAARHPPERCTFLFIDYKGGATAAPLERLPHVVGSVTDLDPRLAQRALVSLRAELTRRMTSMAGRAKDLTDLAAVAPDECPPRLVIVIDEFATLVKEVPDFLAGVVDVAQRGRSLGIHLVLATQRPTGAVNDDILANAPLRLALRVVDGMDSRSVIGTDDAASLTPGLPGRCFVRRGPGGLVAVQVARATAPAHTEAQAPSVTRWALTQLPSSAVTDESDTQLDSVVRALRDVHVRRGGTAPHRPWVPELPAVVELGDVSADVTDDPGRLVVVGLADDPARQRREPAVVDLEASAGLAVFGAGGSGRTTALRTACASALVGTRPDDVQAVVFDFASRSLQAFAHVPHARAVVAGDDLDGVCREIEDLAVEVDRRRDLLAASPGGEWSGLRRPGRPPRLLVVIDGFAAARAALDTAVGHPWWERLLRVIVDGRAVGIHTLVSADRRNDLPATLLGGFASRLVLRMAEAESMVVLGAPRDALRGIDPAEIGVGRGFLGSREVQVAVLAGGDVVTSGAESQVLVDLLAGHAPAQRSPGLPVLLPAAGFGTMRTPTTVSLRAVPIGVDERGAEVTIDTSGPAAVVGPHGSGRSNLLRLVADTAERGAGVDILAVASGRSSADALEAARLRGPGEVLLVVDDAERIADPAVSAAVERWIDERRPAVIAVERGAASRSLTGLVGRLRRVRPIVVLQPDSAAEVEGLVGRRIRFRPGSEFPPGRALVQCERSSTVVQIARLENTEMH